MKIVVLGSAGMLGSALHHHLSRFHEVVGIARRASPYTQINCDLLDPALWSHLDQVQADVIVNAAAITNLMVCNQQMDQAYRLHVELPQRLAMRNEKIVYISTDSVFDGRSPPSSGYHESSAPAPLNAYALTKLMGEDPILRSNGLVIRTNIYGFNHLSRGNSLLEWTLSSLERNQKLSAYQDIIFNPVSIFQLCSAIEFCLTRDISGLLNIACERPLSKAEFIMTVIRYVRPDFSKLTIQDSPAGEILRPKRTNLCTRRAEGIGLPTYELESGIAATIASFKIANRQHREQVGQ